MKPKSEKKAPAAAPAPTLPAMTPTMMKAGMGRILEELFWLRAERALLEKLEGRDHVGLDFFKVVYVGIIGDYRIRLARILDTHSDAFTIRTVHNWTPRRRPKGWERHDVVTALERHGLTMRQINNLASRFEPLRNQIFAHNDLLGATDRKALFRTARIRIPEVNQVTDSLREVIQELHRKWFEKDSPHGDTYTGDDVDEIHRRYIAWRYPGGTLS